jgi:hypothetical protein
MWFKLGSVGGNADTYLAAIEDHHNEAYSSRAHVVSHFWVDQIDRTLKPTPYLQVLGRKASHFENEIGSSRNLA